MVLRSILYGFILSFSSHSAKPLNFINFLRPAQKAAQHDPTRSEEETEDQVLEDGEEALDLGLGAEAGLLYNGTPIVTVISPQQLRTVPPTENKLIRRDGLAREPSVQSDVTSHGSHGSSVESYLESRKPDPEEVLLSLGFGGPVSLDSEVTRIPRRFLQPSKVKGVAIKDFLRHQQELIENFETGFCGYRGLTPESSSSVPSVIVAKIMEKLREHERDSVNSTATSEYASLATTPPPDIGRRFSHHSSHHHHHHHRHMLKRNSAASSSSPSPSSRQNTSLSVLNADNRRFLESQGSKSPEVPRKRMIIGQRSFTFGRDGDLIEVEASPTPSSREDSSIGPVPMHPLKPLVHKDSVLSSATDLSLTSVDSDSDTDERSGSFDLHRRLRVPQSPLSTLDSSAPFSDSISSPTNISSFSEMESEKVVGGTSIHRPHGIGKRMSSTSLSSWESDTNSSPLNTSSSHVENSFGRIRFSVGDPEDHRHKSSHSLLGNLSMRYESIEEDVEMKADSDLSKDSSFPLASTDDSKCSDIGLNESLECSNEKALSEDLLEIEDELFTTNHPPCSPPKVPTNDDMSGTQGRRGSLKRQQNVAEEDVLELASDSVPICQKTLNSEPVEGNVKCEKEIPNACSKGCVLSGSHTLNNNVPNLLLNPNHDCTESEDGLSDFEGIILPQLEIIDECLFKKNNLNHAENNDSGNGLFSSTGINIHSSLENIGVEAVEDTGIMEPSSLLQVSRDIRGDSFEMEEIGNGEDEAKTGTLTRARSDSSGFLEGDLERSENSESKAWEKHKSTDGNASSYNRSSLDMLSDLNTEPRLRGGSTGTVVAEMDTNAENKSELNGFTKRLSLPVVCVIDESGGVLRSRSNSVRSVSSDDTNCSCGSGNATKNHRHRTRRVHSAPEPFALTSSCSSVSNMFSSCSDESVVHLDFKARCTPIQPTAEGIASTFRTNKDLQELLEELAVRGVNLPCEFDRPLLSSQSISQCAPLQADAVRAALNTYSTQLGESMSSLQTNSELLECVIEARHELEIVRDIREQIAAELRRVASLLEEQPGPRAAAITRQMTVLLREQTRLCRQLEALSRGCGPVDSSFSVDSIPRTFSAPSAMTSVPCCNSERLLGAVREENRRLERLVQGHSQELAEIRLLLRELVSKKN